jgi:hypothetical protein
MTTGGLEASLADPSGARLGAIARASGCAAGVCACIKAKGSSKRMSLFTADSPVMTIVMPTTIIRGIFSSESTESLV